MKKIALILTAFLLSFSLAFAVVENLEVPPKQYTGNGVTTDFPITFDYSGESDLTVSFVNDSDGSIDAWTQDALGDQGYTIVGGEIIANTAPDNGRLVIDGETPLTQTLNLKNNRATPAELYESALDKGILATRDVKAVLDRTMTAPATADPAVDYTAPEYEAGSYWQWHPTLKELRNAAIADSTTTIGTDVGDIVELVDDGSGNGVFPDTVLPVGVDVGDVVKLLAGGVFPISTIPDDVLVLSPQRATFIFKDVDEIYLNAAVYGHQGTSTQLLFWNSQLTYAFVSLGVSGWSYLYIDDSAIVTSGSPVITAAQLTDSLTGPDPYDDAKKGFYHPTNVNDRCIFAVLTNGSSEILEFLHAGDFITHADEIINRSLSNLSTTWADVSLSMPEFSIGAEAVFTNDPNADADVSTLLWRTNGSSATTGHRVGSSTTVIGDTPMTQTSRVVSDSSQIIEVSYSVDGSHQAAVYTIGWYFPIGM